MQMIINRAPLGRYGLLFCCRSDAWDCYESPRYRLAYAVIDIFLGGQGGRARRQREGPPVGFPLSQSGSGYKLNRRVVECGGIKGAGWERIARQVGYCKHVRKRGSIRRVFGAVVNR